MTRIKRTARIAAIAATLAAALAAPATASAAPCWESKDTTGSTYNVTSCGVSDIDQFRATLYANGGAYCGPASVYNTMYYMRNTLGAPITNGSKGLIPNPHTGSYDHYYAVTSWLRDVGKLTSEDGSTWAESRHAFDVMTGEAKSKGWKFASWGVDSNKESEFGLTLAKAQLRAPVQLMYGRYTQKENGWERNGGHVVTVYAVNGTVGSNQINLWIYDPSRTAENPDDYQFEPFQQNLSTQSAPMGHKVTLNKRVLTFDVEGSATDRQETRWELSGESWGAGAMVEGFNAYSATKPA